MFEGEYELTLNTPMGNVPCKIVLWMEREKLNGSFEILGAKSYFKDGKAQDDKCIFKGELNTPMGNITYSILGIIDKDRLNIYAETNKGRFKLDGKRIK